MIFLKFCLVFVSVFIVQSNATPRVYVLNLTNQGTEDDKHIKLEELLNLLKNHAKESKFKEVYDKNNIELGSRIKNYPDCLSLDRTKAEKLKCLEKITRNKKKSRDKNDLNNCLLSLDTTKSEKLKCFEKFGRKEKKTGDKMTERSYYFQKYPAFFTQSPKQKIYSQYNYYGGTNRPFIDLTRQEFSQDYLDIGDLSRSIPKCHSPECKNLDSHTLNYLTELSNSRNGENNRRVFENVIQRSYSSDESSESSDSERKDRKRKHRKPKRFEVVSNDDSSKSDEKRKRKKPSTKSSEESEEYKYKKKKQKKSSEKSEEYQYKKEKPSKKFSEESVEPRETKIESEDSSYEVTEKQIKTREKYAYLQGNKVYDSFRRRLQHFLPKRYHWDEDDIHHLGYYWFDGPRGKYS